MRQLSSTVLVILTLTMAITPRAALAQAPEAPPAAASSPAQAADGEQPAGARRQAADTEQPVRLRQRNGSGLAPGPKHVGLLIGGLVTLGASYGLSAGVGLQLMAMASNGSSGATVCTNCQSAGERLLIPVVGPWAALPGSPPKGKAMLAVLGVAQAAGLIMTISGAGRLRDDVVANDPSDPRDRKQPPQWRSNGRLSVLLLPGRDGAAGVLSGSF